MTQTIVLASPLSVDAATRIGLPPREYANGEAVDVPDIAADRLRRAGYATPVGTTPTVVVDFTPSAPAVILQSGGVYALRSSVTDNPGKTVLWIGATSPNIGGGYAITGVDVWIQG